MQMLTRMMMVERMDTIATTTARNQRQNASFVVQNGLGTSLIPAAGQQDLREVTSGSESVPVNASSPGLGLGVNLNSKHVTQHVPALPEYLPLLPLLLVRPAST
eukprot:2156993-Rhodomonas_salina.3